MQTSNIWKSSVVFSFRDGKVTIKNLIEKKTFTIPVGDFENILINISSNNTQEKLVEKDLMERADTRNILVEKGLMHWERRKWVPSIDLYLSSRNIFYSDGKDNDGNIRKEIQKEYGKLPERYIPNFKDCVTYDVNVFGNQNIALSDFLNSLKNRRSIRHFRNEAVEKEQLFNILRKGTVKIQRTRKREDENFLYSYGSAFEVYIYVYNVSGIEKGVYYYDMEHLKLSKVSEMDLREMLPDLMAQQPFSRSAGYTLFLVANFEQYQWRYRHERGIRNLYIEAGRVMQEILIESMIQGIDGVVTPALNDVKIAEVLGIDYRESLPVYSYTCGIK